MAQIKNNCSHNCSSSNGYQTNRPVPSMFTITSCSQAPSLQDEDTDEESYICKTFRNDAEEKGMPQKCRYKSLMCKCRSENDCCKNQNNCTSKNFSNVSINDKSKTIECPIHSKILNKPVPMDIKKLEETYWAKWKPSKCSDSRNDKPQEIKIDSPPKMTRMTSGSIKCIPEIPSMLVPNVNLGNFVQCKTCLKFIEKCPKNCMDRVHCLHRNYKAAEIESSDYDNNTINEEDDDNTPIDDYTSEYTETDCTCSNRITQSELMTTDNGSHRCKCNDATPEIVPTPKHSQKSCIDKHIDKSKDSIHTRDSKRCDYVKEHEDIDFYKENHEKNNIISPESETPEHPKSRALSKHSQDRLEHDSLHRPTSSNSRNSESRTSNEYIPNLLNEANLNIRHSDIWPTTHINNNANMNENIHNHHDGNKTPNHNDADYNRSGIKTPKSKLSVEYIKSNDTNYPELNNPESGERKYYSNQNELKDLPQTHAQEINLNNHSIHEINDLNEFKNMPQLNGQILNEMKDTATVNVLSRNLLAQESANRATYIHSINSVTNPSRGLKGHSYPLKPVAKKDKKTSSPVAKNVYKYKK